MDHAEAIEHIELAAVEPDGLDRLMAGDTPDGALVAGHLAGCPVCVEELARIRQTAALARAAIASAPDPALRERTLAFVREVGRDRSRDRPPERPADAPRPSADAIPAPAPVIVARPGAPAGRWLRWGSLAAALVVAAGLGFGAASLRSDENRLVREVAVLERATQAEARLAALPDARWIPLTPTAAGGPATGTLLLSPSAGEIVMVAEGLAPLAEGEEYGCWVEVDGTRTRIGRMYPGGDLQSWAGPVEGLAALPPDAVFGVSRVPSGGGTGEPLLTGGG